MLHLSRHAGLESASQTATDSCATKKKTPKSEAELDKEWTEKYGAEGAQIIADTVMANVEDYEYLKQFALKV